MPIYEYVCEEDGTLIELIRPMARADDPVDDPENKGRRFIRRLSAFTAGKPSPQSLGLPPGSGCSRCGNPGGPCSAN